MLEQFQVKKYFVNFHVLHELGLESIAVDTIIRMAIIIRGVVCDVKGFILIAIVGTMSDAPSSPRMTTIMHDDLDHDCKYGL